MSQLIKFLKDDSGASAAEYALILAIVGLGIVAAIGSLKNAIADAINETATTISNAS